MPELPDLQVFSQNLTEKLKGKKLKTVRVKNKKKLTASERKLNDAIGKHKLIVVQREGKELHFKFTNGQVLGLHLMLRGKLHYFENKNEERFTILEMEFSDGTGLAMTDYQGQATPSLNPVVKDSPDALSPRMNFTFLRNMLNNSRASIKNFLLDQSIVRGIGNAYADEILWEARISPFSISNKIPDKAIRKLSKAIRKVLQSATRHIARTHPEIIGGEVRDFLKIHNAEKKVSPTGAEIMIRKAGARKTYYTDEQEMFV